MDNFESDEPITSFGLLVPGLNYSQFDYYFEGVRYYIICYNNETRVAVDCNNIMGKEKVYTFDTFEEAINAHIIITDPNKVVGDMFKQCEQDHLEYLRRKKI